MTSGPAPAPISERERRVLDAMLSADPTERASAEDDLVELGDAALGILNAVLVRGGTVQRYLASQRYGMCGERAAPALVPLLSHGDARVRYWAARSLDRLRNFTADVVRALANGLYDVSPAVRTAAALALSKFEPLEPAVVHAALALLAEPTQGPIHYREALAALLRRAWQGGQLGADSAQCVPPQLRAYAAECISTIGLVAEGDGERSREAWDRITRSCTGRVVGRC